MMLDYRCCVSLRGSHQSGSSRRFSRSSRSAAPAAPSALASADGAGFRFVLPSLCLTHVPHAASAARGAAISSLQGGEEASRLAHNQKIAGASPAPATSFIEKDFPNA